MITTILKFLLAFQVHFLVVLLIFFIFWGRRRVYQRVLRGSQRLVLDGPRCLIIFVGVLVGVIGVIRIVESLFRKHLGVGTNHIKTTSSWRLGLTEWWGEGLRWARKQERGGSGFPFIMINEVFEVLFIKRVFEELSWIVLDEVQRNLFVCLFCQVVKKFKYARMKQIPLVLILYKYVHNSSQ